MNYWEDPKTQCPAASTQRRGRGLNSHLGPGWDGELGRQGKGSGFHFPGWTSEVGWGRAVLKGHFLFPTVWSYVIPRTSHPFHPFLLPGKPWPGRSGRKRLQEPKPLTVLPTLLCLRRGRTEKASQKQGSFSPQGSHPNAPLIRNQSEPSLSPTLSPRSKPRHTANPPHLQLRLQTQLNLNPSKEP